MMSAINAEQAFSYSLDETKEQHQYNATNNKHFLKTMSLG